MNRSDFSENLTLEQITDLFSAQLEDGQRPSISEYKKRYPHLADEIDAVFPALVMLDEVEYQSEDPKLFVNDSIPRQLGEYEIIQEIGRGGMGIVFEAKHATMQRRVALKVLPKSVTAKPTYLARFITEARSAGQLHHTNIVPVFEVGEENGLHYYAMQYIHGENLDRVIEDIKRLRANSGGFLSSQQHAQEQVNSDAALSESVARSLLRREPLESNLATEPVPASKTSSSHIGEDQSVASLPIAPSTTIPTDHHSDGLSESVFGDRESSTVLRSRDSYFHRVAAVGAQIADALEYAHGHGVLHRDVKPANLILDTAGTVWVTDFGLAKLEHDDLTHTGDIVGTLRYMAPERFAGKADRRSDVYSLGLTLYELCTLQHAFGEVDRASLVREVTNRVPKPPRRTDENIPLDLETIVLKAIEPQPDRRYRTAKELSDDLKLFLADRPIKARRVSMTERFWRVCRRNPVMATMAACIAGLLVALAFGSLQFALYSAQKTKEEIKTRKESQRHLYVSKLDQSQMRRFSQRIGQRVESLAAVRQAAELLPDLDFTLPKRNAARMALRNEAVAAMALTDLRTQWTSSNEEPWGQNNRIAFDADYTIYAQGHVDGRIRVRRRRDAEDAEDIVVLPSPGAPNWVIQISPDGRYLGAKYHKLNALYKDVLLNVWDLQKPEQAVFERTGVTEFDFSNDSQQLAYATGDRVEVVSLKEAEIVKTVKPGFSPRLVHFSHSGQQVAITERAGTKVAIWNLDGEPRLDWSTEVGNNITAMDWRSNRSILVVGTRYGEVFYWSGSLDAAPKSLWVHNSEIRRIHIHPNRELIASDTFGSSVSLTNLVAERESLRVDRSVLASGFSRDGRLCYFNERENVFGVWEVVNPLLDVFSTSDAFGRAARFHPTRPQVVAMLTNSGIEFWDTVERELIYELDLPLSEDFLFSRDGSSIFTSGASGVLRWPIQLSETKPGSIEIEIGSRVRLLETPAARIAISNSGDTLVAATKASASAIDATDGSPMATFGQHPGLFSLQVTADDQWLLTGTMRGKGIGVWNLETGELVKMLLPNGTSLTATTHPRDARSFITSGDGIQVWRFGQSNVPQHLTDVEYQGGVCGYSKDGDNLAISDSQAELKLVDPKNFSELAVLETARSDRIVRFDFSPDGSKIAMACFKSLQIWDLAKLKDQLSTIGLGWE